MWYLADNESVNLIENLIAFDAKQQLLLFLSDQLFLRPPSEAQGVCKRVFTTMVFNVGLPMTVPVKLFLSS